MQEETWKASQCTDCSYIRNQMTVTIPGSQCRTTYAAVKHIRHVLLANSQVEKFDKKRTHLIIKITENIQIHKTIINMTHDSDSQNFNYQHGTEVVSQDLD